MGMFPFPLIGGSVKLRPKPFPPRWISPQSSLFNYHLSRNFAGTDSGIKMEKITDKIAALPPDANYFSLEFFPPKTQMVGYPSSPHLKVSRLTANQVWFS